ncbi:MAG TPA: hypothetical protein VFM37_14800 [Pseudonocardiaceae bacterium]|nr:hypothetical protein [Pseudonocardiaceae bacterium]
MEELIEAMTRDPHQFHQVVANVGSSSATADYLPWDKIRFKTPPNGLTHS